MTCTWGNVSDMATITSNSQNQSPALALWSPGREVKRLSDILFRSWLRFNNNHSLIRFQDIVARKRKRKKEMEEWRKEVKKEEKQACKWHLKETGEQFLGNRNCVLYWTCFLDSLYNLQEDTQRKKEVTGQMRHRQDFHKENKGKIKNLK
jgi:hypothetical protein